MSQKVVTRKSRRWQPKQKRAIRKLLLVTNRLPLSDNDPASPFVVDFIEALHGLDVAVTAFTAKIGEDGGRHDFGVVRFDWGEDQRTLAELNLLRPINWRKIVSYFNNGRRTLLAHLENHQYDHILALWALPSGWFAWKASLKYEIPYSIWTLGSDINVWAKRPLAGCMIRNALNGAQHLFADGKELAEKTTALSGCQCDFLPSFHKLKQNGRALQREKMLLYLGRIERAKGVFDLLEAFRQVAYEMPDFRLVYVGDGSQLSNLRETVRVEGLEKRVELTGRLPSFEVASYLGRAWALVVPTHSDSIPLVFGEALQTVTPMIVTDVGDLGDLVREHELGVVVPKHSKIELAMALKEMVADRPAIDNAAAALLGQFSPEYAASRFLEVVSAD